MKVKRTRKRQRNVLKFDFDSTRIESGWFYVEEGRIRLLFPDGVMWDYENCDTKDWESLTKAASPGRYLRERLEKHVHHPIR